MQISVSKSRNKKVKFNFKSKIRKAKMNYRKAKMKDRKSRSVFGQKGAFIKGSASDANITAHHIITSYVSLEVFLERESRQFLAQNCVLVHLTCCRPPATRSLDYLQVRLRSRCHLCHGSLAFRN